MRHKGLLITTVCLGLGAAAVLLRDKLQNKTKDTRLGQNLLASSAAADADAIEISGGQQTLKLVADSDKVWHIGEVGGFPADAQKILQLIDDVARSRYSMLLTSKTEKHGDFGLSAPRKLLIAAKDKKLLELKLGDRRSSGGIYLTVGDEAKVYLVDPSWQVDADVENWELKTLVDIKKEQIKSIRFEQDGGGVAVVAERAKADEPLKLIGLKDGQTEKPSVAQLDNLLTGLNFTRRLDSSNEEAKGALAKSSKTVVSLFDGRRYEVSVGNIGEKWFLKIVVDRNGASLDAKTEADIKRLEQWMSSYAFEVSSYVAQRLSQKHDALIDSVTSSKPEAATPAPKPASNKG